MGHTNARDKALRISRPGLARDLRWRASRLVEAQPNDVSVHSNRLVGRWSDSRAVCCGQPAQGSRRNGIPGAEPHAVPARRQLPQGHDPARTAHCSPRRTPGSARAEPTRAITSTTGASSASLPASRASSSLGDYGSARARISGVWTTTQIGLDAAGSNFDDRYPKETTLEDAYVGWSSVNCSRRSARTRSISRSGRRSTRSDPAAVLGRRHRRWVARRLLARHAQGVPARRASRGSRPGRS